MVGVTGSIPVAPTTLSPENTALSDNSGDRVSASICQNKPRTLPKSDERLGKSWAECSSPVRLSHEAQNRGILPPHSTRSESSDDYPDVVIALNDRWRVIECRHRLQWILQHRNRSETVSTGDWRGRSYCRTREALRRCCDAQAGEIGPQARNILAELPERIEGRPA
jgi:hypothetical protein